MRCLVTGAAGFIGSHLCDELNKHKHTVFGIDNFIRGRNTPQKTTLFGLDLAIESLDDLPTVDAVFHLAALSDIVPSIEAPKAYHRANVNATVRLLEWARDSGVRSFTYAASGSCYGVAPPLPTPESARIDCAYPYALTKWIGERYVAHWARVYGMQCCSLRLSNVYGPRVRASGGYGAVFAVFLAQIANNAALTIVGDGTQRRDFTHVSDVVRAMRLSAEGGWTGTYNVGTGESHSVLEIAQLLSPTSVLEFLPKRPGEPDETLLDIARIAPLWKAQMRFEDGVRAMQAEVSNYRTAKVWTPAAVNAATATWFKYLGGSK